VTDSVAFERSASNGRVAVRVALVLLPFGIALGYMGLLYLVLAPVFFGIAIVAMIGYLFTPLGAEFWVPSSVITVQIEGGGAVEAFWAVSAVVAMDWLIALFLLWNFDLAERLPVLGKFIDRTEVRCRRFLEAKPWRQRLALVALALYVALPVQMSGGLVGSILGRVMGVPRRRVFVVVAASSAAGAFSVGTLAYVVGKPALEWIQGWSASPLPAVLGVVFIVGFIIAIAYMVRRARRNHDEAA